MHPQTGNIIGIGLFTAMGVSLGYAFLSVPNVELVSITVFLAGVLLGRNRGALVGIITEILYGMFNPQGMAAPHLLAGMVLGMAFIGFLGGLLGPMDSLPPGRRSLVLAFTGLLCTAVFDFLTTVTYALASGLNFRQTLASVATGSVFYIIHMGSNALLFTLLVPPLSRIAMKARFFSGAGRTV